MRLVALVSGGMRDREEQPANVFVVGATAPARQRLVLLWAGYAAAAWAIGYAIVVRGYHAAGGTIGLSGVYEDPAALRRASLLAGIFLLFVGIGALAFVRPWGLRLPRWLVILPALAGAALAITHALTAYISKPLHVLGVLELEFKGRAQLDERSLILWDLLFYEPWFLGLGILVTLGALHHHERTGGSCRAQRRLVALTAVTTLLLTANACLQLATASATAPF